MTQSKILSTSMKINAETPENDEKLTMLSNYFISGPW